MSIFGNPQFYNSTIRKYVALFGTIFNDMSIDRIDSEDGTVQRLKIPIGYGPKQKYLARIRANSDLTEKTAGITLPRMSFEITNISYAPERKLGTTQKCAFTTSNSTKGYTYVPVPYNVDFQLAIMTKNSEDALRIVEQILPFFTPDWTVSATIIPGQGAIDLPILLNSVTIDDAYEGDFEARRILVWTLDFQLRAYLYGPVKGSGLIKQIDVSFYDGDFTRHLETLRVTPFAKDEQGNIIPDADLGPDSAFGFDFEIIDNTD